MKRRYLFTVLITVILAVVLHLSVLAQTYEDLGYPVAAQVQNGILSAGEDDIAVVLSFRQNPENNDLHDIRFCAVVKNDLFDRKAKTKFKVEFHKDGKLVTEHTPILSRNGGEFVRYSSIYANKVEYKAEEGSSIYVTTVSNIPQNAWDRVVIYAQLSDEYESLGKVNYDTAFEDRESAATTALSAYGTEKAIVSKPYNCKNAL